MWSTPAFLIAASIFLSSEVAGLLSCSAVWSKVTGQRNEVADRQIELGRSASPTPSVVVIVPTGRYTEREHEHRGDDGHRA